MHVKSAFLTSITGGGPCGNTLVVHSNAGTLVRLTNRKPSTAESASQWAFPLLAWLGPQ